jgi:hypothetical protein
MTPVELLLSEGLDLCVRARKMADADADWRRWQSSNPHISKSGTLPIWAEDQYQRDLADWEQRARAALKDPAP